MTKRKDFIQPPELGIRHAKNPESHDRLSGTVLIHDGFGVGYSYISFGDKFLEYVGRAMDRGVGPAEKAYIHVVQEFELWAVHCCYVNDEEVALLWRQQDCPHWIRYIHRPS